VFLHASQGLSYTTVISRSGSLIERLKEEWAEDEELEHGVLDDIGAGRIPPE